MSIPRRLSPRSSRKIKEALGEYSGKVTIDLDNDTIEVKESGKFDPYQTILDAAGTITPERGKELLKEVKGMRESKALLFFKKGE
jgi:hypothetical protein